MPRKKWDMEYERLREQRLRGCYWCLAPLDYNNSHDDHYVPLARGGLNRPSNIVIACAPCNMEKSDICRPKSFEHYDRMPCQGWGLHNLPG